MARKFGMGFFEGYILVQGIVVFYYLFIYLFILGGGVGGLFEALGIFLGFDFCPHSIIHVT